MKKYRAVIFDMDGVLVDSGIATRRAMVKALNKYGVFPTLDEVSDYVGMGEEAALRGAAALYGAEYIDGMKDETYRIYGGELSALIGVFDNIPETVEALKKKGYIVAIASSADNVKVEINLSRIGLTKDAFDVIICGTDIKKKKPDPEVYSKCAKALGIDPKDCIVIEDAVAGAEAASAAGMDCIGVIGDFGREELQRAGCVDAVEETRKIVDVL